jgi:hypothetical protein
VCGKSEEGKGQVGVTPKVSEVIRVECVSRWKSGKDKIGPGGMLNRLEKRCEGRDSECSLGESPQGKEVNLEFRRGELSKGSFSHVESEKKRVGQMGLSLPVMESSPEVTPSLG